MLNNVNLPPWLSGLPVMPPDWRPPDGLPVEPPDPDPKKKKGQKKKKRARRTARQVDRTRDALPGYTHGTFNYFADMLGNDFRKQVNPHGDRGGGGMTMGQMLGQHLAKYSMPTSGLTGNMDQWLAGAPQRLAQYQFALQNQRGGGGGGDGKRKKKDGPYNPLSHKAYGYLDPYYTKGRFINQKWRKNASGGGFNPFGFIGF